MRIGARATLRPNARRLQRLLVGDVHKKGQVQNQREGWHVFMERAYYRGRRPRRVTDGYAIASAVVRLR